MSWCCISIGICCIAGSAGIALGFPIPHPSLSIRGVLRGCLAIGLFVAAVLVFGLGIVLR